MMSPSEVITEAEQIVLGAAMLDLATAKALVNVLNTEDFHRPSHSIVWQTITRLSADGAPTDAVAVGHALTESHEASKVGGLPYLHTLIACVPTVANAGYYAQIIITESERRRLAEVGTRLAQAATSPGVDLARLLDDSRQALSIDRNTGDEWSDPIPLTTTHDLPGFPVEVLPDWLGDMVAATATATQTPADLAGSLVLACLSAATLGRVMVEPIPGWLEQTTLFTCVALGPGNRKSAVFDALTRPIRDAEVFLADDMRPKVIEAATEKAIAMRASEKALAVASAEAGNPDAVNNAKTAAREADEIRVPAIPRLLADDITPEATKTVLAEQSGRLAVMSAEGGIFATIAGRYSGIPDLDVFLKGHAGDMLRVTRKSSPVEHIERPALTVGLAVQPSVLCDIGQIPGFEDRGFLARFLFSLPASTVGYRDPAPAAIPAGVRESYSRRLRELTTTMWYADDTTLTLTAEAQAKVIQLETEREPKLKPGGEWEPILNWANKWTGAIVRVAGLLHIADNLATGWRTPITADTIDAATLIGYYYACHALAVWEHMGAGTDMKPALITLAWLRKQKKSVWTQRDIHRALRTRLTTEALGHALAVLDQHGYVRIEQSTRKGPGRKPAPRIHVHPLHTGGQA